MRKQIKIQIKPQFVVTSSTKFRGHYLHSFQETMLNINDLEEEVLILTAPTGTGKSYSFPLPIIAHKERNELAKRRALIISPTNALINDMEKEYQGLAEREGLKITKLNAEKLNKLGAKGTNRWEAILRIIKKHDIIITNPDILNWAMTGGYSYRNWQDTVWQLVEMVHYFIFDEYHIYDEEQIGNIIGWMLFTKRMPKGGLKSKKFIFASATPEPALANLLKQYDFSVSIKNEIILDKRSSDKGRKIKGKIDVTFLKLNQRNGETQPDTAVVNYLLNESKIKSQLAEKKGLVIYNTLEKLRVSLKDIKRAFKPFDVEEVSGYTTKAKEPENVNADLILATNKVEVGVNLGVHIVLMPTGKYLRNFVQRLGRIARKGTDGEAYIFVEKFRTYSKAFQEGQSISYYDLIEKIQEKKLLSDIEFYEKVIPRFVGAFFFIMLYENLKVYSYKEALRESLKTTPLMGEAQLIYNKLQAIHFDIKELDKIDKSFGYFKQRKAIKEWWNNFLETFRYFRGDTKSIKIRDLDNENKETEYSLEWNLKNRNIVERVENEEEVIYHISGYREEKAKLLYIVETFPFGELNEGNKVLNQRDKWNLSIVLDEKIKNAGKRWEAGNDDFSRKVIDILNNFKVLKFIFTEKRLKISYIQIISQIL